MGAWIEIFQKVEMLCYHFVAPHMGAWIEITSFRYGTLKLNVAPHMGAWIEIISTTTGKVASASRTPHGCVD